MKFLFIFSLFFIADNNTDRNNNSDYTFSYQIVNLDKPEAPTIEVHEWSREKHFTISFQEHTVENGTKIRIGTDGFPEEMTRFLSLEELNTQFPQYKNQSEGYIIRTVLNPDGFFTDPSMILIKEDFIEFDWEITGEQEVIHGLNCYRAETTFRCRDYVAWFAPEIPIDAGPYVFHGLPGLIIRIEEKDENRFFELMDFSPLENPKLNLEVLGLDKNSFGDLPRHCDLEEVFESYMEVISARMGRPDCRNCESRILGIRWSECWDECD